jgi:hypothetical protein
MGSFASNERIKGARVSAFISTWLQQVLSQFHRRNGEPFQRFQSPVLFEVISLAPGFSQVIILHGGETVKNGFRLSTVTDHLAEARC